MECKWSISTTYIHLTTEWNSKVTKTVVSNKSQNEFKAGGIFKRDWRTSFIDTREKVPGYYDPCGKDGFLVDKGKNIANDLTRGPPVRE